MVQRSLGTLIMQEFIAMKICVLYPFYTPSFFTKGLVGTFPDVWLPVLGTKEKVALFPSSLSLMKKIYPENQVNKGQTPLIR